MPTKDLKKQIEKILKTSAIIVSVYQSQHKEARIDLNRHVEVGTDCQSTENSKRFGKILTALINL